MYRERFPPQRDRASSEQPRGVIGWTHRPLAKGIELDIQSSRSFAAMRDGDIDTARLCMTRNQALMLARYLLDATGQTLPERSARRGAWARLVALFR